MPELAEVDYFRKQWDAGIGERITRVHLHPEKRVFRGTDSAAIENLKGKTLTGSEASGKQMLFRFSNDYWLGLHLGMTGKLSSAPADYQPGKHDHLVLFGKKGALIFNDARQYGRVLIHHGKNVPAWWASIGPAVTSAAFTQEAMTAFLLRHKKLPIKSALLLQEGFPGIGNWMADEILWRARLDPRRRAGELTAPELKLLWRETRYVARQALAKIGKNFGDPPDSWLFHERWKRNGVCPRDKTPLHREAIGGRTTAWCARCQESA